MPLFVFAKSMIGVTAYVSYVPFQYSLCYGYPAIPAKPVNRRSSKFHGRWTLLKFEILKLAFPLRTSVPSVQVEQMLSPQVVFIMPRRMCSMIGRILMTTIVDLGKLSWFKSVKNLNPKHFSSEVKSLLSKSLCACPCDP